MIDDKKNEDLEFEEMMKKRISQNFGSSNNMQLEITDERLREMNKKLPDWSLEPPYSFLK